MEGGKKGGRKGGRKGKDRGQERRRAIKRRQEVIVAYALGCKVLRNVLVNQVHQGAESTNRRGRQAGFSQTADKFRCAAFCVGRNRNDDHSGYWRNTWGFRPLSSAGGSGSRREWRGGGERAGEGDLPVNRDQRRPKDGPLGTSSRQRQKRENDGGFAETRSRTPYARRENELWRSLGWRVSKCGRVAVGVSAVRPRPRAHAGEPHRERCCRGPPSRGAATPDHAATHRSQRTGAAGRVGRGRRRTDGFVPAVWAGAVSLRRGSARTSPRHRPAPRGRPCARRCERPASASFGGL